MAISIAGLKIYVAPSVGAITYVTANLSAGGGVYCFGGVQEGDLIILADPAWYGTMTGWTIKTSVVGLGGMTGVVAYRRVTAADISSSPYQTAPYNGPFYSGICSEAGVWTALRGAVATGDPFDDCVMQHEDSAASLSSSISVTSVTPSALLVWLASSLDNNPDGVQSGIVYGISGPASTQRFLVDQSAGAPSVTGAAYTGLAATPGTYGPQAATLASNGAAIAISALMAVKPA